MPKDYSITITLDQNTVKELNEEAWSLRGFKVVRSAQNGGMPLVWFNFSGFLAEVTIAWTDTYVAYISITKDISRDAHVGAMTHVDVELGERVEVDTNGGLERKPGGVAGAIAIENRSTNRFTWGIGHREDDPIAPLCAFPLPGPGSGVIAPAEKVLLMFASKPVDTSTTITTAYSSAALLDLTDHRRTEVSFSFQNGWDLGGATTGEILDAGAELASILITRGDDLGK